MIPSLVLWVNGYAIRNLFGFCSKYFDISIFCIPSQCYAHPSIFSSDWFAKNPDIGILDLKSCIKAGE
jgi:hypothetical protein